jgi:cell division protein FtsW
MATKKDADKLGSPDWLLVLAAAGLVAMGLMMVYSSTFDMAYRGYGDAAHFFKRQLFALAVGLGAIVVTNLVHYRHLMKVSIPIMLGTLIMLAILALTGQRLLLGSSISPGELAKLALVIYIGHWLASKRAEQLRRLPVGPLPFTIIVGIVAGLVMAQPDFSEALVIILVGLIMFFMAGAHLVQFAIGIMGGAAAFVFVVKQFGVAMDRILPFLASWKDPVTSTNEHLVQGLIAIGSGGLFGLGPGAGRMKYRWLPTPHTDSIFAIVGEELGLVGCLLIISLFALLAYRGFRIAREAPDSFGGLLCVGITSWITIQAIINMAVITGTIPYTGIVLPFISVGGSSLVTCLAGVGIMINVSRAANAQRASLAVRASTPARQSSTVKHGMAT